MLRPYTLASIPQYRSGQFGQKQGGDCPYDLQPSQSLNTDQGNSDKRHDMGGIIQSIRSQSLNTDQGNSDVLNHLLFSWFRGYVLPSESQSLNTDQGNSDSHPPNLSPFKVLRGRFVLPPKIGLGTWRFSRPGRLGSGSNSFHPLKLREPCYLPAKMAFWWWHDSCQA
jgi:hypothetical protein